MIRQTVGVLLLSFLFPILFVRVFRQPPTFLTDGLGNSLRDFAQEDEDERKNIIPSEIPFVDSHIHLFDNRNAGRPTAFVVTTSDLLGISLNWTLFITYSLFPKELSLFFTSAYFILYYSLNDFKVCKYIHATKIIRRI